MVRTNFTYISKIETGKLDYGSYPSRLKKGTSYIMWGHCPRQRAPTVRLPPFWVALVVADSLPGLTAWPFSPSIRYRRTAGHDASTHAGFPLPLGTRCLRFAVAVHAAPRKTRFRLLARLYRMGLVTHKAPAKGFRSSPYISSLFPKLACAMTPVFSVPTRG